MSAVWLPEVALPQADPFTDYVSYGMIEDGVRNHVWHRHFSPCRNISAIWTPQITCRVEGDELVVTATAYAHAVGTAQRAGRLGPFRQLL